MGGVDKAALQAPPHAVDEGTPGPVVTSFEGGHVHVEDLRRRRGHGRAMSAGSTGTRTQAAPLAARMAATTAGVEEMVGGSPIPLAPKGASGSGSSTKDMTTLGTSSAVGMR